MLFITHDRNYSKLFKKDIIKKTSRRSLTALVFVYIARSREVKAFMTGGVYFSTNPVPLP